MIMINECVDCGDCGDNCVDLKLSSDCAYGDVTNHNTIIEIILISRIL